MGEFRDVKSNQIRKSAYAFEHANNKVKKNRALEEIRRLAVSELGLINMILRKRCWPILLNVKARVAEKSKDGGSLRFCNKWKGKFLSFFKHLLFPVVQITFKTTQTSAKYS